MAKKYNQETRELILQLNEQGQSVPSLAREYGISEATIFNWKKEYTPGENKMGHEQQLENLTEELGDVLDNLFIIADKYDISLEEIMNAHKEKLQNRYKNSFQKE